MRRHSLASTGAAEGTGSSPGGMRPSSQAAAWRPTPFQSRGPFALDGVGASQWWHLFGSARGPSLIRDPNYMLTCMTRGQGNQGTLGSRALPTTGSAGSAKTPGARVRPCRLLASARRFAEAVHQHRYPRWAHALAVDFSPWSLSRSL